MKKKKRNQTNAKIEGLDLKYLVYKELYDKIDNMNLLSKMKEIKFEHIEKFCDTLIDIQNNLSKEFKYIDISLFKMKNVNKILLRNLLILGSWKIWFF